MSSPKMSRGKFHLSLRATPLENEIAQKRYPKDLALCLQSFAQYDNTAAGALYDQVLEFVNLKTRFGSFWKQDNCSSLGEWLARRNMLGGAALATREIIVRLFDKETYLWARDEVLGELTLLITKYQPDPELQSRDYGAVCDAYNALGREVLNRQEFYGILNCYINTTYKPEGRDPKNNTAPPPRTEPKGSVTNKVIRPNESEETVGALPNVFVVETKTPSILELAIRHIEYLEQVITVNCGAEHVPTRPKELIS